MRVLTDDQFNKLTERIKQLETENQYLKKLLDDAGIPYDKTDNMLEHNEPHVISIKEESITKNHINFFYSMFKGRKDDIGVMTGGIRW